MKKQMFVRTEVQIHVMKTILIPEMLTGFWANDRPANHGQQWLDVEFLVTTNNQVGPSGFTSPRNYNFANVEFLESHLDIMFEAAKTVDPNITMKLLKRQLNELSKIVGGRLTDITEKAVKANRGSNVEIVDDIKVLSNGKGLGNDYWLPIATQFVQELEAAGIECEETRTEILIKRVNREARIFVNGANTLAVEYTGLLGGGTIAVCEEGGNTREAIHRVILEMSSVNERRMSPAIAKQKTAGMVSKPNIVVVQSKDGSIVRRAPVMRVMPTAEALLMSNPFNL